MTEHWLKMGYGLILSHLIISYRARRWIVRYHHALQDYLEWRHGLIEMMTFRWWQPEVMKDPEHNCAEYTVVPLTLWMPASCLMTCFQLTVKLGYDGSGWFLILLGVLFDVLVPFERPGTAQYGIRWPSSCPSKNKDNHESMSPQAYYLKHSGKLWKRNWFVNFSSALGWSCK